MNGENRYDLTTLCKAKHTACIVKLYAFLTADVRFWPYFWLKAVFCP